MSLASAKILFWGGDVMSLLFMLFALYFSETPSPASGVMTAALADGAKKLPATAGALDRGVVTAAAPFAFEKKGLDVALLLHVILLSC